MLSVKAAAYMAICLYFIRKTNDKLVKDYELDIATYSNDGEGCFCVIVGDCPVYASYNHTGARELAVEIKKTLPRARVSIVEDETLDSDFSLEGSGLNADSSKVLYRILDRFYARD